MSKSSSYELLVIIHKIVTPFTHPIYTWKRELKEIYTICYHLMGCGALYFAVLVLFRVINVDGKIAVQKGCDIFQGNWVLDKSYPLYHASQCPFIEGMFNCDRNGRPDNEYSKYKWQPSRCNLPRYVPYIQCFISRAHV